MFPILLNCLFYCCVLWDSQGWWCHVFINGQIFDLWAKAKVIQRVQHNLKQSVFSVHHDCCYDIGEMRRDMWTLESEESLSIPCSKECPTMMYDDLLITHRSTCISLVLSTYLRKGLQRWLLWVVKEIRTNSIRWNLALACAFFSVLCCMRSASSCCVPCWWRDYDVWMSPFFTPILPFLQFLKFSNREQR